MGLMNNHMDNNGLKINHEQLTQKSGDLNLPEKGFNMVMLKKLSELQGNTGSNRCSAGIEVKLN